MSKETKTLEEEWAQPKEVSDVDMAYPAYVVGKYMPLREELPEEFRYDWMDNPYCELVSDLFHKGGTIGEFKKEIDRDKAVRHISACIRSFEPKHEHKIGAIGYLLSLWLKEKLQS
jgi:hypothetical protein